MSILTNTMLLQETTMLGVLPYNVARHYVAAGTERARRGAPAVGRAGRAHHPAGPLSNPVLEPLLAAVREVASRMAR